jgi:glycosyltransferase involved in cell wall biosynthesis
MIPPFDVIVPVRNEGVKLRKTAPALKAALTGLPATVIYALNDTTDDSQAVIQSIFGQTACVLQLPTAGKTRALRAADDASKRQWRVYIDADILVGTDAFPALLKPLIGGQADLTAARLVVDLSRSSGLALRVSRVWADQLARRHDAFMCCTAMNEAGLKQRGPWPNVLADDDWARNRIDPTRRMIVETAKAYMSPPQDLRNWIKVRARWIRGTRELKKMGENYTPADRVRPRGSFPDLALYYFTRLGAEPLALVQQRKQYYWGRDNSTRSRNHV